jgi:predicted secreted protein
MNAKSIQALAFATIILIFAVNTFAGDFAALNFIGFSKDGRYLAFEEYGTQDGSGYPYSNIYFVDTVKNTYAAPKVSVMIENESGAESAARMRSAALVAKKLKQFGIIRGNTGKLLVSHLMTDQTYDDGTNVDKGDLVKFHEEVWSMHREGDYELKLTPVKVKVKGCEPYEQDPFMMELKLTDNRADTSKFLQKDTTLPDSRGCALCYRIQDVYLYKGLIAVFMGVFTQGFEGPDMRFMVAAGKLK